MSSLSRPGDHVAFLRLTRSLLRPARRARYPAIPVSYTRLTIPPMPPCPILYLYQALPGSLYPQCPHALNHSLTAVPQSIVGPHPNPNHPLLCFMALWHCTTNAHKLISWDETTVLNIPSTMFASSSVDWEHFPAARYLWLVPLC